MRRQVLLHLGLERKERLLGTKAPCQGPIEEDLAEMTMNTEEGRQGTAGPNRHQRGPLFQAPIFAQHLRQLLNRRRFEECGQGNSLAKRTLDESEQTHRQERMSAQPEEVVLDADGLDLQYPFPDLGQLSFQLVPGRHEDAVSSILSYLGDRESPPVELSVGSQRQRIQSYEGGRDHVRGQLLLEEGPQLADRKGRSRLRHPVGHQMPLAGCI